MRVAAAAYVQVMEGFRQSLRQSLYIDTPQGNCCRKVRSSLAQQLAGRAVLYRLMIVRLIN